MEEGRDNIGRFSKGHPGFKRRGSGEFQRSAREKLGKFLESKLDDLDTIYDRLPAKEKVRMIIDVAAYFLPKQREHLVEVSAPSTVIDYSRLPEDVLKQVLEATMITDDSQDNSPA